MQKKINIPSIGKVLENKEIAKLIDKYGRENVINLIREYFNQVRKTNQEIKTNKLAEILKNLLKEKYSHTLKKVINATGIVLHTNLGRAPLGSEVLEEIVKIAKGYCNLEFDLEKAKRGNRNTHIKSLIKEITGAEDAVVVNNNAAAVMLILLTFAKDKEVIISRGELIEIGGSFRIPDIMKTSGAKMIEVGTTNRTKLSDYENAISNQTAIIFKAHKSNYFISGFTEEVSLKELSNLSDKHNLIMYYDLGSGLLRKPKLLSTINEPDVKFAIDAGAHLVSFSGDKLLGGPQAGIIIGKKELISKIEKNPLMRVLRVGKLTLAALTSVMKSYLSDNLIFKNIPIFEFLSRKPKELLDLANTLKNFLIKYEIESVIVKNTAKCGGGTLPNFEIESYAVKPILPKNIKASTIHKLLLTKEIPILSILKQGEILFDVFTLNKDDMQIIVKSLNQCYKELLK